MKSYVVGDLHGRADLLRTALDLVIEHSGGEEARFICLGDLVDRGPNSNQVVEILRECRYQNLPLITLQGNHEAMMVEVLGAPHAGNWNWWMGNGGRQTMYSYGYTDDDFTAYDAPDYFKAKLLDDRKWLQCLPLYLESEHRAYVHGGLETGVALIDQSAAIMQWHCYDRNWKWPSEDAYDHTDASWFKHIVHGHEQWAKGPICLPGRTDLDTFAWFTGRLAIGVFDEAVPGGPVEILYAIGDPDPSHG
jgi:serine/threonine protein phosphatase 1